MTILRLQALLLADHIYRDAASGKYVVAGTFHQVNQEQFPGTLGRSVGLFIVMRGLAGDAELRLELIGPTSPKPLMSSPGLAMSCPDVEQTVELAIELPPLPLPTAGQYRLVAAVEGKPLGEVSLDVRAA